MFIGGADSVPVDYLGAAQGCLNMHYECACAAAQAPVLLRLSRPVDVAATFACCCCCAQGTL
jgi:hypothetical protein